MNLMLLKNLTFDKNEWYIKKEWLIIFLPSSIFFNIIERMELAVLNESKRF